MDDDIPTDLDAVGVPPVPMAERQRARRARVSPDVRRQIIEVVTQSGLNGADEARKHGVSEATVHRILKAQGNGGAPVGMTKLERSPGRSGHVKSVGVVCSPPGRRALTVEQQREIVQRIRDGTDLSTDLALEYRVHKSTISRILRVYEITSDPPLIIKHDPRELSRRIAKGIAKAAAEGRSRGPRPKFRLDIQEAIAQAAIDGKATFSSLAQIYGVDPSTISRIVRAHRLRSRSDDGQSLEEIFRDLSRADGPPINDMI